MGKKIKIDRIIIILAAACIFPGCKNPDNKATAEHPKNIILMIGDGMGLAQLYAGITANRGTSNFDRFSYTGICKTSSTGDYVTDSGASATAIATGHKTYNHAVGVDTDTLPLKTILEIAVENGYSTGLIVTSIIVDATPACFAAHQKDRYMYEDIAKDYIHSQVDLFIGGGRKYFENRSDSINLSDSLRSEGYQIAYDISELKKIRKGKVAALLAEDNLPRISGGRGNMLPLSVNYAVKRLAENEKGFFLMVEGSQIDKACHDLDQKDVILETQDFDKAVGVALDFAARDKNTLVIVTADHETAGAALVGGNIVKGLVKIQFAGDFHTAVPVAVFAFGPGAGNFTGFYENTVLFDKMMQFYGFKL